MSKSTLREMPVTSDLASHKQAIRLQGIPSRHRSFLRAAYCGKSLRKAVSAFCLDCVGHVPDEIRNCSAPDCPLWAVRPYRSKPKGTSV